MTIGELARSAGISVEAVRYYEAQDLLPAAPRNASGHRDFSAEHANALAVITKLRAVGVTIDRLRGLMGVKAATTTVSGRIDGAREALLAMRADLARREAQLAEANALVTEWLRQLDAHPASGDSACQGTDRATLGP